MDKSNENSCTDDTDFQAKEAKDTSSPDLLGQNADQLHEPEWHTRNLPRSQEAQTDSVAAVELDIAPTENVHRNEVPAESEPHPVDLTPAPPSPTTPAEGREEPSDTIPAPAGEAERRTLGLIDEPPQAAPPPELETAYEKDARRQNADIALETAAVPVDQTGQTRVYGPTGLALSDGKSLHFPGGTRFATGDIIEFNEHRYQVKVQAKRPPIFYLKIVGLIMLVLLAGYGVASFFAGRPAGMIYGVVVDSATGKILPGTEITLSDGTTTVTSSAGIYFLPDLPLGEYEVRATKPGYRIKTGKTTITSDRDTALSFDLDPIFTSADEEKKEEPTAKKPTDNNAVAVYGTLKLEVDFDDYLIYLNDRIYGKNVKKIGRIKPGKHRITLEKNQYEDYFTKVEIKARRTTNITISLDKLKRKTTPRQRAKTRFAAGKSALDQEQYREAINQFDDALAEFPEYAEARQYRGWAYRRLQNTEQATTDLKAGAELYALTNRYFEAISCVNYIIEMHPQHGEYYVMRGDYHTALDELPPAIDDYKTAVKINKKSLIFQLALAEAYYRNEQFKDAAKVFEKARKLAADPADVYVRLILTYMYAGKDKDLIKRYREFTALATEERLERLQRDPEWKRVLQLIRPEELR